MDREGEEFILKNFLMEDIIQFFKDNCWTCGYISIVIAVVAIVINQRNKKQKTGQESASSQSISNICGSNINQAGGDININSDDNSK